MKLTYKYTLNIGPFKPIECLVSEYVLKGIYNSMNDMYSPFSSTRGLMNSCYFIFVQCFVIFVLMFSSFFVLATVLGFFYDFWLSLG